MPDRDFEEKAFFRGALSSGATALFETIGERAVLRNMSFANMGSSIARVTVWLRPGAQVGVTDADRIFYNAKVPVNGTLDWSGWRVLEEDPNSLVDETEVVYASAVGSVNAQIDGAIVEDI